MESIIRKAKFSSPKPALAGTRAAGRVTMPWETSLPFPRELATLGDLADWQSHHLTGAGPIIRLPLNLGSSQLYDRYLISLDYTASSSLDDASANAAVNALASQVVKLLENNGWR